MSLVSPPPGPSHTRTHTRTHTPTHTPSHKADRPLHLFLRPHTLSRLYRPAGSTAGGAGWEHGHASFPGERSAFIRLLITSGASLGKEQGYLGVFLLEKRKRWKGRKVKNTFFSPSLFFNSTTVAAPLRLTPPALCHGGGVTVL